MSTNSMRELLELLQRAQIEALAGKISAELKLSIDAKTIAGIPPDVLFEMKVGDFLDRTNAQASIVFTTMAPHGSVGVNSPPNTGGPVTNGPDQGITEPKPDSPPGGDPDAR